jgi:NAD(P)H dehydrogenase (quinone)
VNASRDVRAAVIYYSATGTTHKMAQAAVAGAEKAGAETRLRKVQELAPREAIESNEAWAQHAKETADLPEATMDDLEWADVVLFGTPTRFGNVSAQLKQYIDAAGPLWESGKLLNKVFAGFCSTGTAHGGQESTLLTLFNVVHHWGGIVVTPGYAEPEQFEQGNPYGGSHTSENGEIPPDDLALGATELIARRAVQVGAAVVQAGLVDR